MSDTHIERALGHCVCREPVFVGEKAGVGAGVGGDEGQVVEKQGIWVLREEAGSEC